MGLRNGLHPLARKIAHRQADEEAGTAADLALDDDVTAVLFDDLMRDGQPQTTAFLLRREEGIENVFDVLFRDADAGITNLDLGEPLRPVLAEESRADLDASRPFDRLNRV